MSKQAKDFFAYLKKKGYRVEKKDVYPKKRTVKKYIVKDPTGHQVVSFRFYSTTNYLFIVYVQGKQLNVKDTKQYGLIYESYKFGPHVIKPYEDNTPLYISYPNAKKLTNYVMSGWDRHVADVEKFYARNPYADQPYAVPVSGGARKISNRRQRVIVNETKKNNKKSNPFMKAKEKARKANKKSFTYNGVTYVAKKINSGLVVYRKK